MAVSSSRVLRCVPRRICFFVRVASQRATRLEPPGHKAGPPFADHLPRHAEAGGDRRIRRSRRARLHDAGPLHHGLGGYCDVVARRAA